MDLTDNKIPFGLLTPEEQDHLRNWPHGVELYSIEGWAIRPVPVWFEPNKQLTYRTKPAPKPAPVTRVHWANDYGGDDAGVWLGGWYGSREKADKHANRTHPRIAVIRREWTKGQPPKYFTEYV